MGEKRTELKLITFNKGKKRKTWGENACRAVRLVAFIGGGELKPLSPLGGREREGVPGRMGRF